MKRTLHKDTINQIGDTVTVKGWVHAIRKMGKVTFFDLRDMTGLLQVVLVPAELNDATSDLIDQIRPEYVLSIEGTVQKRGEKQINEKLVTGAVELLAGNIEILNEAETPPFEVDKDTSDVNEELRLKYRYLDLRSQRMSANMIFRHNAIRFVRDFLSERGFIEVQTPVISQATPEGARDYLIPSRVHAGKFFALPQSPQQYKQMLMIAGVERYFQIAPCFRDEDARANRSPGEFYQIDIEMAFADQEDVLVLVEEMVIELVKQVAPHRNISQVPFPRVDYDEAMKKHGKDDPDLRKDPSDSRELAFAWILNWPLFEAELEDGHYAPSHHMFTMPKKEDLEKLESDPASVRSYQHDLVLNGMELGGGSIRIHKPEIQEKIFDLIGFGKVEKANFAHMLEAFKYGAPPHGGIALGIERLLMNLLDEKNVKEVTAFPKLDSMRDPLMNGPSEATKEQLDELHINIKKKAK